MANEKVAPSFTYGNGRPAFKMMPDGSGFLLYPSGHPAACVSTVTPHQNRYFFYEDQPTPRAVRPSEVAAGKAKEHLLCAVDEHGVGYAIDNTRGKQHGSRVVMNKTGCLLADGGGQVQLQWKWDRGAMNAGAAPAAPVVLKLNGSLTFTIADQRTMSVRFR